MNRSLLRALLGAVVGAPILIACQTPTQVAVGDFCAETGNHCIVVSVSAGNVIVDNDYLRKHGAGKVRWRIENDNEQKFKFPPGGIAFRDSDGGTKVFTCDLDKNSALFYICQDPGTKGEYKYTVTVTDGSSKLRLDPSILND
jgi:hypothetical protein